jgi:hypothetical protein
VQKALAAPDVQKRISDVGGEVTPGTPAQFGKLIHDERVRYEKLVREANIRLDLGTREGPHHPRKPGVAAQDLECRALLVLQPFAECDSGVAGRSAR